MIHFGKTFLKQKKKWIVFIILLILVGIGISILLPRIDSICFRRKVGTLNEWREMCNREEAYFLNYDIPDRGEHGDFPYQENFEMAVANKGFAYPVTTYLASPVKRGEDGTITLLYHSGENYEREKEVKVHVKCEKVTE